MKDLALAASEPGDDLVLPLGLVAALELLLVEAEAAAKQIYTRLGF